MRPQLLAPGLNIGAGVRPHHVGVLGYLVLASDNLGEAMQPTSAMSAFCSGWTWPRYACWPMTWKFAGPRHRPVPWPTKWALPP